MTDTATGIAGLDRIAQIKLPVTDLARSVAWYRDLLDLRLWAEFLEDGVVRGVGLIDPRGRFNIALRDRSVCAASPDLRGFDVVAFLPASGSVLTELMDRCARLGIAHNGVEETPAGPRLDIPDPDGTVLRFYHFTESTDGFVGVESRDGRIVGTYQQSRLG
ncbi:VOC family protein [Actinoplanes aureus]|uniref:VOC family protein n=1 Tax=Actinoplanes aureus TaxID=2792083 RepID=A0A931G2V0_9ACTN|nr:VOC family protein [Actinoplanes aureus]MBG0568560.1 VOC family protein [Actinoplanes aureus]